MDSVQRSAEGGAAGNKVPPIVHDVLRSPGQPLDPAARAFFEPRFGFDFSRVRIHADARAAESARAVHARAYTVGRNVVMGGERFSPLGPAGRRLLAHELAHAVQQGPASAAACEELTLGSPGDAHEREAERAAAAVFAGTRVRGLSRNASPALVARTPVEVRQATEAEQAEIVEMAARWLTALAERVETMRSMAAAARATTQGSAAAPRAFHQQMNTGLLEPLLQKAISVFEAQRSHNPAIDFPSESPEQTLLGEAYARAMEQLGLALEETRANAASLAPSVRDSEEASYARNHLRWLAANPAAPLAAGVRTTFTQAELDLSARHQQQVSAELADLVANVHLYDLSGNGADRLRQALYDATYRLERDQATGSVNARRDTALQASIQPVLDQLSAIQWAIGQAVDRLTRAEARTRAFAADPVGNKAAGDTLQAHFSTRDPGYATLLADRLARMARELRGQGSLSVHARDPQDPECGAGSVGAGLSITAAHADANRFFFCRDVTLGDEGTVSTVIHETVHAVIPNLGATAAVKSASDTPGDRAYAYERIYSRLSTEEALDNAESYAFYVDALLGVAVARPEAPHDEVTGCADEGPVRDAIARATYRIRLAAMWAGQTASGNRGAPLPQWVVGIVRFGFPQADAVRAGEILAHLSNLASRLEYYLPVVCRPATDAEAKAGALVYGPKQRATAGGVTATSRTYPAGTLRICPAWFQADPAVREDSLTSILVLRYRDTVPVADVGGLVALARHIQEEAHPSVAGRTLQQHQAADAPPAPKP